MNSKRLPRCIFSVSLILACLTLATPASVSAQQPNPYHPKADVVEDGVIDIFDLSYVSSRYGSSDPSADLNGDGIVDIFDLVNVSGRYGTTVEWEPTTSPHYQEYEGEPVLVTPCSVPFCLSGTALGQLWVEQIPQESHVVLSENCSRSTTIYQGPLADLRLAININWNWLDEIAVDVIPIDIGYVGTLYPPASALAGRSQVCMSVYTQVPGAGWIKRSKIVSVGYFYFPW
jgi:hypothetical protein